MRASVDETTGLLESRAEARARNKITAADDFPDDATTFDASPYYRLLPLAFLAALAIAATAATSVFAYASLLCRDPRHCSDDERSVYAGAVALATTLANVCGLLALGPLERMSRKSQTRGLMLWLACRSSSVVLLAAGVYLGSIYVALSGRLLEGLASDNLLHFNLNTAYAQVPDRAAVTRLIGASLGVYMVGISISPVVAGAFSDFSVSFVIALGLFALFFLYLVLAVDSRTAGQRAAAKESPQDGDSFQGEEFVRRVSPADSPGGWKSLLTPLRPLFEQPVTILPALSLLVYNTGQAYVFEGIMVYTTIEFGFTGRENGRIISIVHAISAAYIFAVLFLVPWLRRKFRRREHPGAVRPGRQVSDSLLALASLVVNAVFLVALARSRSEARLYQLMPLFSVGLAASGFIKSSFVAFFPTEGGSRAVAALAVVETAGALLSPAILGAIQTVLPGRLALLTAAGMMGCAAVLYGGGVALGRARKGKQRDEGGE